MHRDIEQLTLGWPPDIRHHAIALGFTLPASEDSMPDTSETTIAATMTLNEISLAAPRTLEVFARHGLDSCCGGAKPLALVCERHGLDVETLLAELRAL